MAARQKELPGKISVRLDEDTRAALEQLSESLRRKDVQATLSDLVRGCLPDVSFLWMLAALGIPTSPFVNQLIEDGLRYQLLNDRHWPVIEAQVNHPATDIYRLFEAHWRAKNDEPGYWLEVVKDKGGKVLGCWVHGPQELELPLTADYWDSQRRTLKEAFPEMSDEEIEKAIERLKAKENDGRLML